MSTSPRRSQTLARLGLGGLMVYAGVSHLSFKRQEFQAQVPEWFPGEKDPVVIGSGVVEILLGGAMLALPRHRELTGVALAGFYAAIFPGNIDQYAARRDGFGLNTDGSLASPLSSPPRSGPLGCRGRSTRRSVLDRAWDGLRREGQLLMSPL
ncbi:DoxX family protein [Cutibacterium avidum]|uniref:DoxX family protein n=1 Tax=Cutibacterium avidum TaxID=33010 RepID=UPI001C326EEB|nr:DoxX protein [Cutibacterium avidum]BCQ03701.1 hypothetical protein TPCV4_21450 [Cutibacterium avidum]